MRHARAALLLAALMGVAGLAAQAEAPGGAGAAGRALLLAQGGSALGADEAAALVRSASGGRILGVRRVNGARGPAYEVKVLLDGGRVRVYVVDATSGQILP